MDFQDLPLLELFSHLQKIGLPLGVGEYSLLIESLQGGFGIPDLDSLCRLCCLLWAKSPGERGIVEQSFEKIVRKAAPEIILEPTAPQPSLAKRVSNYLGLGVIALSLCFGLTGEQKQLQQTVKNPLPPPTPKPPIPTPTENPNTPFIQPVQDTSLRIQPQHWGAIIFSGSLMGTGLVFLWLAKRKPKNRQGGKTKNLFSLTALPLTIETDEIQQALQGREFLSNEYHPLSQRQMKQKWRHLRHLVRQGRATELDLRATVEQIGHQGFLLQPIFVPPRRNLMRLLLLLDWDGSMLPFHRLAQRLFETAATEGKLQEVQKYYFNNCPTRYLYRDAYHQEPVPIDHFLKELKSQGTVALIFSDGGALRGRLNAKRLRATQDFLGQLQGKVQRLVWLNPLPAERWEGTTAGKIARLVEMREVSVQGFQQAINLLRGHTQL